MTFDTVGEACYFAKDFRRYSIPRRLTLIYANIGRGHPFYLDGLVEAFQNTGANSDALEITDVFAEASGLSSVAWRLVRTMYRWGASVGPMGRLYASIRHGADYNRDSFALRLLGKNLRGRYFQRDAEPLVVAHPTLVGILRGRRNLIYQHGECVVPVEALVHGADQVLVPTKQAAEAFRTFGYSNAEVFVSGLCVEPSLVAQAEDAYRTRAGRLAAGEPLTGAFFSSGAEPPEHVERLILAVNSHVEADGSAHVFAVQGGRLERALRPLPERCTIHHYRKRVELDELTAEYFAQFDFLVAPPHERTNWALGLGLPMFAVTPLIGSFAPLNLKLLSESGVAVVLSDREECRRLGETVRRFQSDGALLDMSCRGWGRLPTDGFRRIADHLSHTYLSL